MILSVLANEQAVALRAPPARRVVSSCVLERPAGGKPCYNYPGGFLLQSGLVTGDDGD